MNSEDLIKNGEGRGRDGTADSMYHIMLEKLVNQISSLKLTLAARGFLRESHEVVISEV